MLGEIGPLSVALVLPVGGMAAIAIYEWWNGRPRASVLSSALLALAFFFLFVTLRGEEMFGLSDRSRTVAVGLEVVFMIGAIYFLRKHQSSGTMTKETA